MYKRTLSAVFSIMLVAFLSIPTALASNLSSPQNGGNNSVRGGAPGVICLAPGNRHQVNYDLGRTGRVIRRNATVGADWSRNGRDDRCVGRCGANCFGAPSTSRMYTEDCLEHDICSASENASDGARDSNCGDEFDNAVGDTILSLSNICRYRRGDHGRANRGNFGVGFGR